MILQLVNLSKQYGQTMALDSLNLEVEEGGIFAFLGPNGAGKTTTIRILNGLTMMSSGQARIAGLDIAANPIDAKKMCGLAAQTVNLDGELTVAENLDFHGRLHGVPKSLRRSRSDELLDYVELADRAASLVKELAGGMKRRLMVARALMHRPRLLFLDEPTAGLDPAIRRRIWTLVKKVSKDGVTVFLTTHYIEEAEFLADSVGFIHQGRLVARGTPAGIAAGLGKWAVDRFGESDMQTVFFESRKEANDYAQASEAGGTVRRVNLEDAFLSLTGKRVN